MRSAPRETPMWLGVLAWCAVSFGAGVGWAQETPPAPEQAPVEHEGWTLRHEGRHGSSLRGVSGSGPKGWRVYASLVSLEPGGFVARGEVRVSGPDDVYVTAGQMRLGSGVFVAGEGAALVGRGWTIQAKRIEVDVARVQVRMEGVLGAADPR